MKILSDFSLTVTPCFICSFYRQYFCPQIATLSWITIWRLNVVVSSECPIRPGLFPAYLAFSIQNIDFPDKSGFLIQTIFKYSDRFHQEQTADTFFSMLLTIPGLDISSPTKPYTHATPTLYALTCNVGTDDVCRQSVTT